MKPDGGARSDHDFVDVPSDATNALVLHAVLYVVIKDDPELIATSGLTVMDSTLITDTPRLSVAVNVS